MKIDGKTQLFGEIGGLAAKIIDRTASPEKAKEVIDLLEQHKADERPAIALLITEYKQLEAAIAAHNASNPEAQIDLNEALRSFASKAKKAVVNVDLAAPQTVDGRALRTAVLAEVGQAVVGNESTIELMLIAQLCRGHLLMEGPVGSGKTHLASSFCQAEGLRYKRQQFVADLLPADVVGTEVQNQKTKELEPKFGTPAETDLYHADEFNRAPPKAQGGLLEAMAEGQISIGGVTRKLSDWFMVIATQNPESHEGTYTLTEANRDRFMFKVNLGRPTREQQARIMDLQLEGMPTLKQVVDIDTLREARAQVRKVRVEPPLRELIISIVRATWPGETENIPGVTGLIAGDGASERANGAILQGARALAFLRGRDYVTDEDVLKIAPFALRHRIELSASAKASKVTPDQVIQDLLTHVQKYLND